MSTWRPVTDPAHPNGDPSAGPPASAKRPPRDIAGIVLFCVGIALEILVTVANALAVRWTLDAPVGAEIGARSWAITVVMLTGNLILAAVKVTGIWLMVRPVRDRAWATGAIIAAVLVSVVGGFVVNLAVSMLAPSLDITGFGLLLALGGALVGVIAVTLEVGAWVLARGYHPVLFVVAAAAALIAVVPSAIGRQVISSSDVDLGLFASFLVPTLILVAVELAAVGVISLVARGRRAAAPSGS